MQPGDETYILYGALFLVLFVGLLFNFSKFLGSSKFSFMNTLAP